MPSKDRNESYAGGSVADNDGKKELLNERRRQSQRRWGQFNPRRKTLEVPLPEDVAFRSVEDGGAGNILPSKRKRPIGIKSTERVIVGGARSLGGIPVTGDYHATLQKNENRKHLETNGKNQTRTKKDPPPENTKEPENTINVETNKIPHVFVEDLAQSRVYILETPRAEARAGSPLGASAADAVLGRRGR